MVSFALLPAASKAKPSGPKVVLAPACVAIAPTFPFAHGTTAPTAKNLLSTAMPMSPVAGSKPTMENVPMLGSALEPVSSPPAVVGWEPREASTPSKQIKADFFIALSVVNTCRRYQVSVEGERADYARDRRARPA